MYSAYKLNKQVDNIQPWCTPFPIWNQSVVPCPVLSVASWPAYRFLKRQVRWSGIPFCKHKLLFCMGFSLAVVNGGNSLVAVHGFLIAVASLVENHGLLGTWAQCLQLPGFRAQAQQLWYMGLVALWLKGSSRIRDWILLWQADSLPLSHQGSPLCCWSCSWCQLSWCSDCSLIRG